MKKTYASLISMLLFFCATAQLKTSMYKMYSTNVKDSFEIYVSASSPISAKEANVVYYCDANLKSGRKVRELIGLGNYQGLANTIFVGIGHIGNYHKLRRRDFILPEIKGKDTIGNNESYGQVAHFYQFLKLELIPKINSEYKTNPNHNAILGHSLGGLFAFYCLFKNENIFQNYFALSPALWIDKYSIYHFNYLSNKLSNNKKIYFSAGSQETMNHILKGTNEMNDFLKEQNISGLTYEYQVQTGKTHNSQVPVSLDYIFTNYAAFVK